MEAAQWKDCHYSTKSDEDMCLNTQENGKTNDNISNTAPSNHGCTSENISLPSGSHSKEVVWRGTSLNKLTRISEDQFPHLKKSSLHTVLFKLPVTQGQVPKPLPVNPLLFWNKNHFYIPHCFRDVFITIPFLGELPRWELIKQSLSTKIQNSYELEVAILGYYSKDFDYWDFSNLHSLFPKVLKEKETENFFQNLLPKIIDLALSLPKLVTHGIPLLTQHSTHSISLSQQQISCLLANAFLCTFPFENPGKKNMKHLFHSINFDNLFSASLIGPGKKNIHHEKLKCLINYFERVTTKVPEGVVTFSRHFISPKKVPTWYNKKEKLCDLYISDEGTIEDEGTGMLEIDFANKVVGGAVLGRGCLQEEIRFITYPELILARLFTAELDCTEALIVQGCERFNKYKGYSVNFEWAGNVEDSTPRDRFGRRCCTVVAIDALMFPKREEQYKPYLINRELTKAYAGFSWGMIQGNKESVASGNWGCGAFRGDVHLKALLQLMAASIAGRQLAYFTFGQPELRDSIADMHSFLVQHEVTVGDLWSIITTYKPTSCTHSLYDQIYASVTTETVPRPLSLPNWKSSESQIKEEVKSLDKEVVDTATLKLSTKDIDNPLNNESIVMHNSDAEKPDK